MVIGIMAIFAIYGIFLHVSGFNEVQIQIHVPWTTNVNIELTDG